MRGQDWKIELTEPASHDIRRFVFNLITCASRPDGGEQGLVMLSDKPIECALCG